MPQVSERTGELDGLPYFWREAPGTGTPILYLHGVPTASWDWLPFLERTGGLAPDLPGFGRSAKRGDLDYSIDGLATFVERFLDELVEVERVRLVVHDWGAAGLAFAQRHPERVERLVLINAVPLLPGYRWHRFARAWRTRLLGELSMGLLGRTTLRFISRASNATPGPLPAEMIDRIIEALDPGTQRAILLLYRSAPSEVLAAAGAHLHELAIPALVIWGEHDPYIPVAFADAYAERLPGAELERLPDAGHWPWLDRPEVIERVASFLGE